MRTLNLPLPTDGTPLYRRLARAVRRAVQEGQVRPGELLPSTRQLGQMSGAHRHTVMAALDELVAEGWLVAEAGRGYRVISALPGDPSDLPATAPPREERAWRLVREAGDFRTRPDPALPYAFPSGQPDLRLFPTADYYACLRDVLRERSADSLLGYADAGGVAPLLDQLAVYLRRMRGLGRGSIVVTHGSQEAIFLLGQLLIQPGDTVAVEALGYSPAWAALRTAGAVLEPIPVDGDGIVPEAVETLARRRRVRLLYVTPLHQYPTTVTLPLPRRMALYAIAERHGIPILEDDYDHEFHYRSSPLPPLASQDPGGRVLYVSTFSKVLYPAARLGFAVVPEALAGPLRDLKRVVSRQNDTLVQEALARWMEVGGFERHLRRMRRVYAQRMDLMIDALTAETRDRGVPLEVKRPDGGMSLWVSLGCSDEALARAAAEHGVGVMPGSAWRLGRRRGCHLRLGFASSNGDEIAEGVRRLVKAAATPGLRHPE